MFFLFTPQTLTQLTARTLPTAFAALKLLTTNTSIYTTYNARYNTCTTYNTLIAIILIKL